VTESLLSVTMAFLNELLGRIFEEGQHLLVDLIKILNDAL
jgi:hypothetical protein